jgi:iron-sulfur cluster repair di-iron protein
MPITPVQSSTVGEVVTAHPKTRPVFERLGIDSLQTNTSVLSRAAEDAGVDPETLMKALSDAIAPPATVAPPQLEPAPGALTGLVKHIEGWHHTYLRTELPRLASLVGKLTTGDGSNGGAALKDISEIIEALREEIASHLVLEEEVLFPHVRYVEAHARGDEAPPPVVGRSVSEIVRQMAREHESVLGALGRIRDLTSGYQLPDGAPADMRTLYDGLRALHEDLGEHIRLENDLGEFIVETHTNTTQRLRMETDLRAARELQEMILPNRLPQPPGSEAIAFHVKASPGREVGGDLYEAFFKDERTLVLALGDVSGSGAPAALLMTMTWTLLRTFTPDEDSPSEVLRRMNRGLLQANAEPMFATLFLAYYNTRDRTLRYASAGHCPPILGGPDGYVDYLDSTATVLGVFEQFESKDRTIVLSPGQRLVSYSDGITEACSAKGEMFGIARLAALVSEGADRLPQELLENILNVVRAHGGESLDSDDTTIWVLDVLGRG